MAGIDVITLAIARKSVQAAADKALADAKAAAATQIQTAMTGLAKIAWSGNVKDLVQDEGDVLVFYCGTSTEVI